jgi:AcrR family transcriptional regulator
MSTGKLEGSPRERLLAAATELFYEEGVHTVGIDRVIERAGVAKASLYSTFGSKEELVRAYLAARQELRRTRVLARIEQHAGAREKILAVFDYLADLVANPTYRGCAFLNASAEERDGGKVRSACHEARAWLRELMTGLAREAGARDPDKLSRQLVLLYDGATIGAAMDAHADSALDARATAEALLDAAIASTGARGSARASKRTAASATRRKAKV